jgi:predicted lysophospholipase L1 biosynthesis ABC-type transport system permease subunit
MRTSLVTSHDSASTDRIADVVDAAVERLAAVPGVVEAAATCCVPLESDWLTSFQVAGRGANDSADQLLSERRVSPSYFRLLEIPLLRGRAFTAQDRSTAVQVAVVNQTMVRQLWPGRDPLGAQVRLFPGTASDQHTVVRTIVGVVADVRDGLAMAERPRPTVYVPLAQVADSQQDGEVAWLVRHRGREYDQAAAERAIRTATRDRPVFDVNSLEGIRGSATTDTTLRAALLALFSCSALLLAMVGVYSAVSTAVRQRWHDLSIRLALGARPTDLRRRVVGDALRVVSLGTVAGLLGAFLGGRTIAAFLFGVSATSPWVFLSVALVLTTVAVLAAWVPASRVLRLDIATLLRRE